MTPDSVLQLGREAMQLALMLSAPVLLVVLLVGVVVGLFQAATQINEMTLSFIPKVLALAAVMVATGPWALRLLLDFTRQLFQSIPSVVN